MRGIDLPVAVAYPRLEAARFLSMVTPKTEVLITVAGAECGRYLFAPGEYILGRNPDCHIRVEADLVSRRHAKLTLNFDNALIEDLGSSNGTLVNGKPVAGATRLWPNQKIQIGTATIELRRLRTDSAPDMSLAPSQQALRDMLPEEILREKKYDIGGVIAKGGMGAILDAKEVAIKRRVAMKVMLDTNDAEAIARFIAEAQVTGQLEHPNIVPIYELGVDENGQVYYTMKMVRGITLKKVLELLAKGVAETAQKFPLSALLTVFQKVCDAIAFAHSKGVIHRDLKPENIMLGDFGSVLVMDWGLAKVLDPTRAAASVAPGQDLRSIVHTASGDANTGSMTLAGTIMGTPQYMAPEQARGEIETLDARTDIYALGAILFHVLFLRAPVSGGDAMQVVGKVARGEVEWPSPQLKIQNSKFKIPPPPDSLLAVCRKALALDPAARYARTEDLQADILAYQNGFATSAEKAGWLKRATLAIKRNKTASAAAAIILALSIGFTAKVIAEGRRAERALADLKASAPSLLALAESEAGFQRFDSALVKLDAALALDPALTAGWWRRAWLLLAQEKFAASAGAVRAAQSRDPANAARLGAILPLLDQLQATPAAERWNPERSSAVLAHLNLAGASGEAIGLSSRFQLSAKDKLKMVIARLEEWLGKPNVGAGHVYPSISADGSIGVSGFPKTIDTMQPLRGLPINSLGMGGTAVKDLEPLRDMPLHTLSLGVSGGVTDLSPLHGMRLLKLDIGSTRVADLSPLAGMPLTELNVGKTLVGDLSPLKGMPLKSLTLNDTKVRDLTPLKGMALEVLNISGTLVSDLGPLKGMPLRDLNAVGVSTVDAAPLGGMPLKTLKLRIVDCSPLAGMELDYLDPSAQANLATFRGIRVTSLRLVIGGGNTKSLEPLKDVHFKILSLDSAGAIRDLSPLRDCRGMEELSLDGSPAPLEPLRGHPTLKFIAWKRSGAPPIPMTPVEKFWPAYDAQQAAGKK